MDMHEITKKKLSPESWTKKLKAYFSGHEGAIIAYSGGVDSALLAYVAHLVLGKNMLAALAAPCWLMSLIWF
jgi:PP-loop superfamily ATP-utilizing enzyme